MLDSGGLDCVRELAGRGGGELVGAAEAGRGGVPPPLSDPATPSRGLWRAGPAPLTSLLEISLLSPVASTVAWTTQSMLSALVHSGSLGSYWPIIAFVVPSMRDSPRSKCKEMSRQIRNRGMPATGRRDRY